MRRGHDRLGVGGAAELEVEQRHAADRALFDHPRHLAVLAFLQKDAWHVGRDAEADVDGPAVRQFHGDAARDHLLDVEGGRAEGRERPEDLARDRRVVGCLRGLQLVGIDDDVVDQNARHPHVVRLQSAVLDHALDLRDDDAAIGAGGHGLLQRAEIGALVLIGQVAAFVGAGGADDGDLRRDRREIKPFLAVELFDAHDRVGRRRIHGAALLARIDERVEADLGQHARPLGGGFAVHVEQDAGRDVVGGDRVLADHLPDSRRLGRGGAGGVGAAKRLLQQAGLGQMVDALDAPHVAGGDGVQRGQVARMTLRLEARADGGEHRVRTAEAGGGGDGDDGAVGDEVCCFSGGDKLGHA